MMEWIQSIDEFGRNHFLAIFLASVISLLRALFMSSCLIIISAVIVLFLEVQNSKKLNILFQSIIDAIESVPIYIWILAGVSWIPSYGLTVVTGVFVVAGLPIVSASIRGAVAFVISQPYYAASVALGTGAFHRVRFHIIPNALPLCLPVFIHVVGAALAVYGAIGVFGFINRETLDIGVFLLRGKEQAGVDATVLLLTLFSYSIIFLLLYNIRKIFR